ncbi:Acyl-CoA synthetase family member 2, mitochondrial [Amphibalanus amphitrite]|uniref:Medium-chain acyl-CoA ligase ACSF2, mitochondrial n=1 Tax=Amphibalanus amphitrite TaxID=1232801 RepID=A0A6A4VLI0_AMPAM|nr:Acyl-CoA synthetase family member 2, mitochondrial [Amphibalanus amphitrite]
MYVDMVNIAKQKRHDLSSLYSGIVAGAPVPFHLMRSMIEDLNMRDAVVGYGLTETSPLLTVGFPSDDLEHRCGTVGFPLDHSEVKVVGGDGRTLPVGHSGELCMRGYNRFLGYWDDEAKTRECVSAAGWFHTGDVATMTEDGYVKIVGTMGEELVVWVRTRELGCLSEHDVRSFCKGRIAHYKVPRYIQFRDDFPKTVTGKIQKFVMRNVMCRELGLA